MTLDRRALVAEAMLAPSVHNVQPARWRLLGEDGLLLLEDRSVRLRVGDPTAHDAAISLGAAVEGLRLAAGRQEALLEPMSDLPEAEGDLLPRAAFRLVPGTGRPDPLSDQVDRRQSWRGAFARATDEDRAAAAVLATHDTAVVTGTAELKNLARLADTASHHFMQQDSFRRELTSWMRLSRRHPRWSRDGLNAEAMAMGRLEAWGAGLVLGPLYGPLEWLSLAAPLTSEADKTASATGLAVFHRPADEDPFISGGHFYRCWLRLEDAGFGAAVIAALADHAPAAAAVSRLAGLADGRRVVSTFRIGRRPEGRTAERARRSIDEILV